MTVVYLAELNDRTGLFADKSMLEHKEPPDDNPFTTRLLDRALAFPTYTEAVDWCFRWNVQQAVNGTNFQFVPTGHFF